jgi:hypothetical protein
VKVSFVSSEPNAARQVIRPHVQIPLDLRWSLALDNASRKGTRVSASPTVLPGTGLPLPGFRLNL